MLQTLQTPGDTSWFTQDRFGLFIHWGLYSLAGRHEWVQHFEQIPPDVYEKRYFNKFDPDLYNPEKWADAAAGAGMKYFVVTTKHHEGFCLFDSKHTQFKATNTPAKRDLIKPMVKAFNERGLRTGFYYSVIDWHHPEYIVDKHVGPYTSKTDAERAAINKGRNQAKYAAYIREQAKELLTKYGKVDVMWFDFSFPKPDGSGKGHADWESDKLYKLVRKLQPNIMLDDRLDLEEGWDFKTPEQFQPYGWIQHKGTPVVWEACQTFSGSWGYFRDEQSWKSVEQLVFMLIDTVSKGGNLLLNVGPTSRGEFDYRAMDSLAGIGKWMGHHNRSIYGCTQAPAEFKCPQDCRLTYNPKTKRLYLHILNWPFAEIHLPGFAGKIEYAQFLHDGSEVQAPEARVGHHRTDQFPPDTMTLRLPVQRPNVTYPVVEMFLKD
jgi:alpha-L-fucosidase